MLPRFISERVDINVILAASDQDLIRLGISTIGDRCRLRDVCRRRRYYNTSTTSTASMNSTSRSITTPIVSSNSQNQNTVNNFPDHSNSSSSFFSQVREERSLLFAPCRAEEAAAVEQHQPLALVDLHRSVIRNQGAKLGQLPLYV